MGGESPETLPPRHSLSFNHQVVHLMRTISMKSIVIPALGALFVSSVYLFAADAPPPSDGATDATAALQQLLDTAGKNGGEVRLPAGQYLLKGSIQVPPGVT